MPENDDQSILDLIGKPESRNRGFELLVHTYQERVYWLIRRIVFRHEDADDVVQNVFLQVWLHLDSFRRDSRLFTWIYRIAVNEAIRWQKKNRLHHWISFSSMERELGNILVSDPAYNGTEVEFKLQKALLHLPFKQRLVFQMKYMESLKYEEMSAILGTSVGALKASYHHAVKKIERFLANH